MKVAKFIVCFVSAALLCAPAFAQEDNNRDENGKINRGPYLTNNLGSNWFVSVGGGVDWLMEGVRSSLPGNGAVRPALDITAGKWFTPDFGVRAGYYGLWTKLDDNKMGKHQIHGDLLWNLSNQIGGYKETRVYNAIPYLSAAYMHNCVGSHEFLAGAGFLNNFRITNHWLINLDARMMLCRADQFGGSGAAGLLSATVGVTYNIGKCTWTRFVDQTDAMNALKDANSALENANKALANDKNALASANDKLNNANKSLQDEVEALKKAAAEAADAVTNGPCVLYFPIGQSSLNTLEAQHLRYFLENVDKSKTLSVTGSADAATGSQARNEQLCAKRVETVVAKLRAAGISDDQIIIKDGQVVDIESPEMGRTVVIEY